MTDEHLELHREIVFLQKRYAQMSKAVADTVAETLPLDQQQKFFLHLSKKLDKIKQADVLRKT